MTFSLTTFVFEVVNFLALTWILARLVYRPLREGIQRREAELSGREKKAADALSEAEALGREARAELSGLEELRVQTLNEATEQASRERARLMAQARDDAAAERARAQRLLEAERESAHAWVKEIAVARGSEVAGRMLMDLAPDAVNDALFDKLLAAVEQKRGLERVASATAPVEVEVAVSRMPTRARLDQLRATLERALGGAVTLVLRETPALEAGLTLRIGHLLLDASVSGQLAAFREHASELIEREVEHG